MSSYDSSVKTWYICPVVASTSRALTTSLILLVLLFHASIELNLVFSMVSLNPKEKENLHF